MLSNIQAVLLLLFSVCSYSMVDLAGAEVDLDSHRTERDGVSYFILYATLMM